MRNIQNYSGKGTYQLVLNLDEEKVIDIGSFGRFRFQRGYYIYIGSAQGSGGLKDRLNHHLNITNKPHWHIDYLRRFAEVQEIWITESEENFEHEWAELMLEMPGGLFFINGFGSSDCACISHLFYFREYPSFESFQALVENIFEQYAEKLERINLFEHA